MAGSVPVIDMAPLRGGVSSRDAAAVIARIDDACTGTGFFVVTEHGMEGDVAAVLAAARSLFALPMADKAAMAMQQRCGYVDDGAKELFDIAYDQDGTARQRRPAPRAPASGPAMGSGGAAPRERAPSRWPRIGGFRPLVERYQARALDVAATLLLALAVALGVETAFFADRMRRPECFLRMLHYPPRPAGDVTTRPHSDYGALTLLATDGTAGLQVHPIGGPWIGVEAPPGSFVVNLGDLLARWTNDRYVSTPHRVVSQSPAARYSVPFFVNPDPDTVVACIPSCTTADDPPRYEPVTATEFLQGRIDGTISVPTP